MYTTSDIVIDENTGDEVLNDKLIMIFSREESRDLYILWKRHELKWNDIKKKKLKNM